MGKKVAVFYYTQSGQALEIVKSVCKPLLDEGYNIVYKEIIVDGEFPFPWKCMEFFEAFPETRLSQPPFKLKDTDLSDVEDAELVIVSGQSWYLSPSLPIQSFFQDEKIKNYLKGKNIVNISGCRNMWIMAQRKIRKYIYEAQGNYVGNIVLQDKVPNLVSILTIIRWLFYNQKQAGKYLPAAGVSDIDIEDSSKFGEIIIKTLNDNRFDLLQNRLMEQGAVNYVPSVVFIEKAGHRIFGLWAKFIKKKGDYQIGRAHV